MKNQKNFLRLTPLLMAIIICLLCFAACNEENNDLKSNVPTESESSIPTESETKAPTESETKPSMSETESTTPTSEEKFEHACSLIKSKKIEEAYELLKEIDTYGPAKEKLENFVYAPTSVSKISNGYTETTNYEYDAYGNISSITTNNDKYNFTYDADGNVLTGYDITYPNNNYVYSYKNGKLDFYTFNNIKMSYEYNSNGLISKVTKYNGYYDESQEFIYRYTYYQDGTIKSMSYPLEDAVSIICEYDVTGNVKKIVLREDRNVEDFGYFELSHSEHGISSADLYIGNNLMANYSYTYDSDGKLVDIRWTKSGTLSTLYALSEHKLCYVENASTLERLAEITQTSIDRIISVVS